MLVACKHPMPPDRLIPICQLASGILVRKWRTKYEINQKLQFNALELLVLNTVVTLIFVQRMIGTRAQLAKVR